LKLEAWSLGLQPQVEFYFSTSGCIAGAMIGTQLLAIALMTPLTSQSLTQPAYQVTLNVATNLNFILTHMRLLKNAYEQNLARCIGAPQGADFFHIPVPRLLGRFKSFITNPSFPNNLGTVLITTGS